MSMNVVAAWPLAIVCASDRRLVSLKSGEIITNRSTKLLLFGCSDAHGVITYNGIGLDHAGSTPCDWLFELHEARKSFNERLPNLIEAIRADLATRLRDVRLKYGRKKAKHTFVCAAWHEGRSLVHGISNYERIDDDTEEDEGREDVFLTTLLPGPGRDVRVMTTGAHSRLAERAMVAKAIKTHSMNRVKAAAVKVIRNAAYRSALGRGPVGSVAQWAALGADRDEVWYGLDIVGGAHALEPPNLLNIAAQIHLGGTSTARIGGDGMSIKNTYFSKDTTAKTFAFAESNCGVCGAPWPKAQRFCEVCQVQEAQRQPGGRGRRPSLGNHV